MNCGSGDEEGFRIFLGDGEELVGGDLAGGVVFACTFGQCFP